jgi:hypothetical protein
MKFYIQRDPPQVFDLLTFCNTNPWPQADAGAVPRVDTTNRPRTTAFILYCNTVDYINIIIY